MAFWNKAPEVNRQFRWYMIFNGIPGGKKLDDIRFALKKAAKPVMKISETQHKYLNHYYYYPGRVEWDPITVSFAAVANPQASHLLNLTTTASGYMLPTSPTPAQYKTISKVNAIKSLTDAGGGSAVNLIQINEAGDPIEWWKLWNPFFTDIKYDSLEYGSEDILNLDATIRYDYATLGTSTGDKGENFLE